MIRTEKALSFLKLLDKGLDIGFGLLLRITPQIIEITIYGKGRNTQFFTQSFRHTIPGIGVVWSCLGIVEYDTIQLKELMTILNVLLLVRLIPDNKKFRVGHCHTLKRVVRV